MSQGLAQQTEQTAQPERTRTVDQWQNGEQVHPSGEANSSKAAFSPNGFVFPIAITKLTRSWLGSNTPNEDEILARFGAYPAQETLKSLAQELHSELEFGKSDPTKIANGPHPLIAELNDQTSLIILSSENGLVNILTSDGRQKVSLRALKECLTGNWLSVHPAIGQTNLPPVRQKSTEQPNINSSLTSAVKRLISMATKNYRPFFVKLFSAAILSNLLLVVLPLFITLVYDRVVPHGAFETLTALTFGVLIALGVDTGLRATRVNLQEAVGVKFGLNLQSALYRKLVSVPLVKSQQFTKGFSATLQETEQAALLVPSFLTALLADLPFVFLMLLLVFSLAGIVVIVPIMGILLIATVIAWNSFKVQKRAGETHEARIEVHDQAIETAATIATTKATGTEHLLLNDWERRTDTSAFLNHQARQSHAFSTQLMLNITQLTIVMTIVVGAIEVNAGMMTLGNLAATTLLVGRIISPVSQLIMQLAQLAGARGGICKALKLLDTQDETGGDVTQGAALTNGNISMRNICFSYPNNQEHNLKNIQLDIGHEERIGIIGRNGSGKSTLLKLLPRLFEPDSGQILFDGVDARQISPLLLRQSMAYMSQDTELMNNSIRANILSGNEHIDDALLRKIADISGVSNIVDTHPQGFNLSVGPRGQHLSGGERQAVGLARTLAKDPKILVLDEPTSAMDNTTEALLINKLPSILEGRTLILSTHRMQLLKLVDRIIWMENGTIVADGPRNEVLEKLQKKQ
ncbi:ATP-binding cassette domain-containing protein [Maritalea sp.]|uniref:ATP-binding cassette domain-containing protein n=1 Tax=Maritalea sp. TaxID=2003361 RepID=UPI003EF7FE42